MVGEKTETQSSRRGSYKPVKIYSGLQVVPVGAETDILPFVEGGYRLRQDAPDAVVAIATQQNHWGKLLILRSPFTLDDVHHGVDALLRVSRLVEIVC